MVSSCTALVGCVSSMMLTWAATLLMVELLCSSTCVEVCICLKICNFFSGYLQPFFCVQELFFYCLVQWLFVTLLSVASFLMAWLLYSYVLHLSKVLLNANFLKSASSYLCSILSAGRPPKFHCVCSRWLGCFGCFGMFMVWYLKVTPLSYFIIYGFKVHHGPVVHSYPPTLPASLV